MGNGPESSLVFEGSKRDRTLSDMICTKLLRDKNLNATSCGFRLSFKVWAAVAVAENEVSEVARARQSLHGRCRISED